MINLKQSNRYYLDFNATSPYSRSVEQYLKSGGYLSANASSTHSSGKKSKRYMREVQDYIMSTFGFSKNYQIFFHSGATEGINTLLYGAGKTFFQNKEKFTLFVFSTDHSSVMNQREEIEALGHKFVVLSVNENGDFSSDKIIEEINKYEGQKLLNYTWVNNETGVCWDLSLAEEIKAQTGCFVHVDAVQAPGKIADWKNVSNNLDAYTYSAHKFGSLKGVGFSLVNDKYPFHSLLRGGGQQNALRSGTENVDGIYSVMLAMKDLEEDFQVEELAKAKIYIEGKIKEVLKTNGRIIADKANCRNLNTIYLVLNDHKADITTTAFDIGSIDVSSGSACSSGSILPSRVLMAMGVDEERAKSALRFSFPYNFTFEQAQELAPKLTKILQRFC